MERIRNYLFSCTWWNDYSDDDEKSYGVIGATSYSEAVDKIVKRLPHAGNIFITEADDDFLFMGYDTFNSLINSFILDEENE